MFITCGELIVHQTVTVLLQNLCEQAYHQRQVRPLSRLDYREQIIIARLSRTV